MPSPNPLPSPDLYLHLLIYPHLQLFTSSFSYKPSLLPTLTTSHFLLLLQLNTVSSSLLLPPPTPPPILHSLLLFLLQPFTSSSSQLFPSFLPCLPPLARHSSHPQRLLLLRDHALPHLDSSQLILFPSPACPRLPSDSCPCRSFGTASPNVAVHRSVVLMCLPTLFSGYSLQKGKRLVQHFRHIWNNSVCLLLVSVPIIVIFSLQTFRSDGSNFAIFRKNVFIQTPNDKLHFSLQS